MRVSGVSRVRRRGFLVNQNSEIVMLRSCLLMHVVVIYVMCQSKAMEGIYMRLTYAS